MQNWLRIIESMFKQYVCVDVTYVIIWKKLNTITLKQVKKIDDIKLKMMDGPLICHNL